MSLELGRSSAARDDNHDSESAEVNDAAPDSGAKQPPDEGTSDGAPRRSVLAPFMIADSANDSLPEGACDDLDEDSDDAVSDIGQVQAPESVDAFSPAAPEPDSAPDASTPAHASANATTPTTPTTPRWGDEETAATSDGDETTGSGAPLQGAAGDRSASDAGGADSPPADADAASPATAAASSVPAPRSGGTEPRLDSGGLGKAGAEVDEPLLEDAEELRTNWLRLQAGFVDDPHEAVSDAADLVEHTAQALVGALRKRQQELRGMWDGGGSKVSGTADASEDGHGAQPTGADTTEQLRLLMKRYRVLFNHICRS
jgi:hypothetical protein